MTSKDTKRKLIKENKNCLKDTNILHVRRTVSTRSPSSDLKCPMQIISFLGQDDRFYLSTKSSLNHPHHPALKAGAILRGQMAWSKLIYVTLTSIQYQCYWWPNPTNYANIEGS